MEHKEHFHGSDLEKIEAAYHIKKENIISFSANVNPLGLSPLVQTDLPAHLNVLTSYPDREYSALRQTIADYVGSTKDHVLVGNGSSELISLFAKVCLPHNALILGPTYSEYEHSISMFDGRSSYFELKEADNFVLDVSALKNALDQNNDLLILCNPNNPTSALIPRETMHTVVEYAASKSINVIVDETYMEFCENFEDVSAIPLTDSFSNLVVLRGVSKFFASPGLRLGYAVTKNTELISAICEQQIPWSINSLADEAGKIMFSDKEYIRATKNLISSERARIYAFLQGFDNLKVYEPHANFILVRIIGGDKNAQDLFETAIRRNLMIRDCASFTFLDESFFRFCFMKPEENNLLLDCIRELFQ